MNNLNVIQNKKINDKRNVISVRNLVIVGMMGAISTILMLFEFGIPFSPSFVKMDFSELPVILGGFLMGPIEGFLIIVMKIVLNFLLNGTSTFGIGELSNMMVSVGYMLPTVFIYRKIKGKKGTFLGILTGVIVANITAVIGNMYFIFPAYAKLYGMSIDSIVAMGSAINPYVTDLFTMMCFSMIPFNIFKFGSVSIIAFTVYKKMKLIFN